MHTNDGGPIDVRCRCGRWLGDVCVIAYSEPVAWVESMLVYGRCKRDGWAESWVWWP